MACWLAVLPQLDQVVGAAQQLPLRLSSIPYRRVGTVGVTLASLARMAARSLTVSFLAGVPSVLIERMRGLLVSWGSYEPVPDASGMGRGRHWGCLLEAWISTGQLGGVAADRAARARVLVDHQVDLDPAAVGYGTRPILD